MQDLITALITFFLIEPLQAEMADKLKAARAPQAILTDVSACVREARPILVERATSAPWWAVSNAAYLWIGVAKPADLLAEAAPACKPAIEAARLFLSGEKA